METSSLNEKGQIFIPLRLRKKFCLKKGSKIGFIEYKDKIILQPLGITYYKRLIGIGGTNGKAMKSLLKDKKNESPI